MKNTLRTHACFVMHGTVQQSERVMRLLTMIMHFHSAVTDSPGAIFTEISQWRWCYVTAALDPAVHIANASHCGGGGGHVLYPGHIQAPAAAAAFQLLLQPSFSHSGLCWAMLLSHGYILSTVQPCSGLLPLLWSLWHQRCQAIPSNVHMTDGYGTDAFSLGFNRISKSLTEGEIKKTSNHQPI